MISNFITWTFNPDMISWPVTIRWYGMMFAIGFILGVYIISKIFKHEGVKQSWVDSLFVYVILCTVIGARLGHVFFYAWDYYSQNPGEILKVWHGGLASHGGTLGLILALVLFCKKTKIHFLDILDMMGVAAPVAAGFIRLANLMNSEIIGMPSDVLWAFIFERVDMQPRHPAQLYEALAYFLFFLIMVVIFRKKKENVRKGFYFGLCITLIFTFRFFVEFLKERQVDFENALPIDMGQILSIPFIVVGLYFVFRKNYSAHV